MKFLLFNRHSIFIKNEKSLSRRISESILHKIQHSEGKMNALLFIIPISSIPLCKTVPLEVIHFLKDEEEILSTCISCGLTIIIRFKVYPSKEFMEAVNFKREREKIKQATTNAGRISPGYHLQPRFCKMILQDSFSFTMSWRSEKTCSSWHETQYFLPNFRSITKEMKIGSGSSENWNKLDVKFQMSEIKGNFLCFLCVFSFFLHPRKSYERVIHCC